MRDIDHARGHYGPSITATDFRPGSLHLQVGATPWAKISPAGVIEHLDLDAAKEAITGLNVGGNVGIAIAFLVLEAHRRGRAEGIDAAADLAATRSGEFSARRSRNWSADESASVCEHLATDIRKLKG